MEVKTVFKVAVLLLVGLNGARAAVETYFMEGGNMVLEPKVTTTITNILWKHNGNLLAEWVQGLVNLTYYRTFVGRTTLSTTTGRLLITKMTKELAGAYTLEINSVVHGESYTAKMIKAVPRPSVWIQPLVCNSESKSCTMICEGRTPEGVPKDTKEAEPITYSWRRDEDEWNTLEKELIISKDTTSGTKTFSCQMKNPVSTEDSEPKENPFYEEPPPSPVGAIAAGVLIPLLIIVLAGFLSWRFRDRIRARIRSNAPTDNPDTNGSPAAGINAGANENVPLNKPTEKTEDGEPKTDGAATVAV